MTKSMTEGSPIKLILSFSLPLLLGNILQQAYNMIDAAIVGRVLGVDALAAVSATSSVLFLVLGFCIGICAGFGIPMAKYFGANQPDRLRSTVFHSYLLTGIFAVVLTVLTCIFCNSILDIMKVSGNIRKDAYIYLFIIFTGIPFSLFYNLLSGMLRAIGDSKTPFIFLAVSAVLNIILDFTFILIIPLGCAGAALATIMAQA
ncbi:MAG: polysaccharide biosynthesis C-terminal domain-containing protein, partial [Ruminococcus sp.]|nr:polysaccharide biosynthesis C-terminal domain-containing protein [Ruminococcus sp.]